MQKAQASEESTDIPHEIPGKEFYTTSPMGRKGEPYSFSCTITSLQEAPFLYYICYDLHICSSTPVFPRLSHTAGYIWWLKSKLLGCPSRLLENR